MVRLAACQRPHHAGSVSMGILQRAIAVAILCLLQAAPVPARADEFATKDEAVSLVHRAIAHVAEVGMAKAAPEFMDRSASYIDRDLYLIIIDKGGVRVVHGQNPKLVGKTYYDAVDVNGKAYGREVQQIAE